MCSQVRTLPWLDPADAFLLNDPYVAGGNHLPDWVIARPVFAEGALVAFACNRAHQSDIGGGAAGTYNPQATEIFHEGIRLPPLKLVEAGRTREDLWQLLMINTRCPDLLDGDLRAMLGATRIGGDEIVVLLWNLRADQAEVKARGFEDLIAASPFERGGKRLTLGLSAGFTMLVTGDTVEAVLARADQAMYARKRERRES